jgi:hypothetical protein
VASLTLIFSSAVNAYSFGTVNQGSERVSETNRSFKIDVLNLNNRSLELNPSVEGLEKGNAVFQSDRIIEPSRISENPEGSGWVSIEPGKYAKPETFRFNVISAEYETGEEEFSFQIEARTLSESDSSGLSQRVVHVREYKYSLKLPEDDRRPAVERGFESSEQQKDGPEIIRNDETEDNNSSTNNTGEVIRINHTENSQATKTSNNSTSTRPSKGVNPVTLVLSVGIAGSLAYLWMIL